MGQYWEAFSWVDCFINKLKWRKTCQNVISFLEMLKWDDCALYVLSASNTTNDFSLLKNPMNWSDQWSTMKCEAVLCVRLKEGEGFPDVQSCHEDQSLKRPPRPDVFLYQPLYICILVHTNTWSLLAQTCALIFQTLLRRKTLLPAGSCIIITFPMIDFLITTISVQFRAFSIDWHVYKMRMNQKVNQMTNSFFYADSSPDSERRSNIFLLQKTDGIDEVERTAPMS